MADRGYPRAVDLSSWKGRAGSRFDIGNWCRYDADKYKLEIFDPVTLNPKGSWEEVVGGDPNCPGPLKTITRYSSYAVIALGANGAGASYSNDALNAYNFLRSEFANYDQTRWDQNVVGDFDYKWDIVPRTQ